MSLMQKMKTAAVAALLALSGITFMPQAAEAQDAATPAATEAPLGEAKIESVENPYGIGALWAQGDFVSRGVLVMMLIMSGATWYIMIVKFIDQSKLLKQARAANETFWKSKTVADGLATLSSGSPFWYIADRGVTAQAHHEGTLVEQIDLSTWVTMSVSRAVDEIQSRLQGGLAVLATVGSTAPFVGLFGTVWGIYHALLSISTAGQATIDKVAGPIGEALIMTALGLAVAIPAVLGYNALVRGNKAVLGTLNSFAHDLHAYFVTGARVSGNDASKVVAMKKGT